MNIPFAFWLVPAASAAALGMAWHFYRRMTAADEGTPRMREIARYVRNGAMAYLKQQYKVVACVFAALCALFAFMAYGLGVQNPWVPFAFLSGGLFSALAGYFGMKSATQASARRRMPRCETSSVPDSTCSKMPTSIAANRTALP